MANETKTEDLAEIIVKAIEEEPFFKKEVLIPKITAIIKAFRLRLTVTNFQKEGKPSDFGRLLKSNEIRNIETKFWKDIIREKVTPEEMQVYYNKLEEEREKFESKR